MSLTVEQKSQLKEVFELMDKKRLLYGPDEKEAIHLHGMMLAIREGLESRNIEIPGVTGYWWYEKLDEPIRRQMNIDELIRKYGTEGNMAHIIAGVKGGKEMLERLFSN